jgi:hypothetical protein
MCTMFRHFQIWTRKNLSHRRVAIWYSNSQASTWGYHRISPSVQKSTGFCRQFICYYLFFPVLFPYRRKQSRSVSIARSCVVLRYTSVKTCIWVYEIMFSDWYRIPECTVKARVCHIIVQKNNNGRTCRAISEDKHNTYDLCNKSCFLTNSLFSCRRQHTGIHSTRTISVWNYWKHRRTAAYQTVHCK